MKTSKRSEVGHIRRRKGISMKMMMNEEALQRMSVEPSGSAIGILQEESAENDENRRVKYVGYTKCEAQDDT
jgi:hypothetical protein